MSKAIGKYSYTRCSCGDVIVGVERPKLLRIQFLWRHSLANSWKRRNVGSRPYSFPFAVSWLYEKEEKVGWFVCTTCKQQSIYFPNSYSRKKPWNKEITSIRWTKTVTPVRVIIRTSFANSAYFHDLSYSCILALIECSLIRESSVESSSNHRSTMWEWIIQRYSEAVPNGGCKLK